MPFTHGTTVKFSVDRDVVDGIAARNVSFIVVLHLPCEFARPYQH